MRADKEVLPSRSKHHGAVHVRYWMFEIRSLKTLSTPPPTHQVISKLHQGFAHHTDGSKCDHWEFRRWVKSLRISGGRFFSYKDSTPIFPGDFILVAVPGRREMLS